MLTVSLGSAVSADPTRGDDAGARIGGRLDRIEAREDAHHVAPATERARRALDAAARADDQAEASRSLEIAHAATVLAERQLARRALRVELIETQERITATRQRAEAQRRVLEALLEERAALARAGEDP